MCFVGKLRVTHSVVSAGLVVLNTRLTVFMFICVRGAHLSCSCAPEHRAVASVLRAL